MPLYALTIFLSSFLLFQVQPLIGKYILPWFGGTPSVWTTCLLFFQLMLLLGYCYAHLLALFLSPKAQGLIHSILLATSLLLLPITPSEIWKTTINGNPTWYILALLTVSIGGPYLMLSTSAPLLQSWFSRTHVGRSPFRLYALSNVGALLALFTFPSVIEPFFARNVQSTVWSVSYVLFAVVCGMCAWRVSRVASASPALADRRNPAAADNSSDRSKSAAPEPATVALWLGLAFCGSVMLMATTNQMCQDVAAVPFLWVLPLGIYLLSFVICFDREQWYNSSLFALLMVLGIALASAVLTMQSWFSLTAQIAIYSFCLFACCMSCHGELVKMKPHPRHLTLFYLTVSAGGALGGTFVTFVAPTLFNSLYEYQTGLVGSALLVLVTRMRTRSIGHQLRLPVGKRWGAIAAASVFVVFAGVWMLPSEAGQQVVVNSDRNFFGFVNIVHDDPDTPEFSRMSMFHGTTNHGCQYQTDEKRQLPTMYFVRESGIGVTMQACRKLIDRPLRIGVIGLGTGTIASYCMHDDYVRFFEINPMVIDLADRHFSYLRDAKARGADVEVLLGDARIVMEQQLEHGRSQQFDVLAIDAFSGDSIPMHLLTKECFEIYWKHLVGNGILVAHTSNHYTDLSPVVRALAETCKKQAIGISYRPNTESKNDSHWPLAAISDWILVTDNQSFISDTVVTAASHPWPLDAPKPLLWTDDFSSLFSVLR